MKALNTPKRASEPRRGGLGRLQQRFEHRDGGTPYGVHSRHPSLVSNGGDELLRFGIAETLRVDAYGDYRSRLDEGRDLFVEASCMSWGRAGYAGYDLLLRSVGAEDEAIWTTAVQNSRRNAGVGRMGQRALAFDQD